MLLSWYISFSSSRGLYFRCAGSCASLRPNAHAHTANAAHKAHTLSERSPPARQHTTPMALLPSRARPPTLAPWHNLAGACTQARTSSGPARH